MELNTIFRINLSVLFTVLISLFGCKSNQNKEDKILGQWKAHWETKADESLSELQAENLHMEGLINFTPDGKVEISAFGYEGCIFSNDTLRNVLTWKIDDSIIRFIDKGDDHGLPYTINKFTNNEMQLTLLEDISLTLRRD